MFIMIEVSKVTDVNVHTERQNAAYQRQCVSHIVLFLVH